MKENRLWLNLEISLKRSFCYNSVVKFLLFLFLSTVFIIYFADFGQQHFVNFLIVIVNSKESFIQHFFLRSTFWNLEKIYISVILSFVSLIFCQRFYTFFVDCRILKIWFILPCQWILTDIYLNT